MSPDEPKLRIPLGLIGCGAVGRLHAERLRADARVELAVCCDPDERVAAALRDKTAPHAAVETDACRALTEFELEAAVICSPTQLHFAHACAALDRGLDVLCEKPLCADRGQIMELARHARDLARVLSVSYQRRYLGAYVAARRELAERADLYGPLQEVHIFVCERWRQTIDGTWRDDPGVGAGYFGDAGSHQIDVVHFVTGRRAMRLLATSDRRTAHVEIVTRILAELEGGAGLVAHFVGDANHWREDIHFHCREADLLLRSEVYYKPRLFRARDNQVEAITELPADSSPDGAFVDAILTREPTVSPVECAVAMHDWTAAVLASARTRQWVDVPNGNQ